MLQASRGDAVMAGAPACPELSNWLGISYMISEPCKLQQALFITRANASQWQL